MAIQNVTEVIGAGLQKSIETLITAIGIVIGLAGIYLVFWIINMIVNYRRNKLIKELLENVKDINKKLRKKK